MPADHRPHVDGSGRGLDDGTCIHCGSSGSLADEECAVRLRAQLDEARAWVSTAARVLLSHPDVASDQGVNQAARHAVCAAVVLGVDEADLEVEEAPAPDNNGFFAAGGDDAP